MSKKIFTLLVIFFISISALIYINIPPVKSQKMISPESISLNKTAVDKNADLYFSPSALNISSTSSATLDIILEHSSNAEIIQLEISYDPLLLYNLEILPGNYFDNPTISHKIIDEKNGRVSYVLEGVRNPADYTLTAVAKLSFNSYNVLSEQITPISFLPKTAIKTSGNQILKIDNQNAQIVVKPQFYFQVASQSATN